MRIKKVVLHGFKTFANKTEFLFDSRVTAIVGPNGSGKSNVADGVRWCMGEQSFSLLRSKKTSDVIFAGSDRKARLGMASVHLTLDNDSGELPIDFEEVEVGRRAYRDGDNDYLLNGQRVRLLDVTEMLAPSGLGKRTYAVIGQGLIDQVLSLKPEERRSLFEEAAGITGYQSKRGTTMRRLEATQANLTRVQDIVAEISPRLRYLKRQASRYEEFSQIEVDLKSLLRQWYGYRWHHTLQELESAHKTEQNLGQGVASRQQAMADVRAQLAQTRQSQATLSARTTDQRQERDALLRQAEQVRRELAVAQERATQMQARRGEMEQEVTALTTQAADLSGQMERLAEAVAEARRQHQARQADLTTHQLAVQEEQSRRRQLQQALEQARSLVSRIQNASAERRSQLQQIRARRTTLQAAQSQQDSSRQTAQQELDGAQQAHQRALELLAEREAATRKLQSQISDLAQERQTVEGEIAQAEQARQQVERTVDRLQTRHDLLTRLHNEGAGYASGVRTVLQSQELTGILGTVASLIRAPAELDRAMETALGGALQNVITAEWQDARAAIAYLKRTAGGRATFLPLDRLSSPPPIPAPVMAGILGNGADLVDYDPQFAPVVQQLLGRLWVAENLDVARQALDRHGRGAKPTVVTLGGEIVRPGGAVTGGEDRRQRDESILAREREFRSLPAQIQSARQEMAQRTTLRTQADQRLVQVRQTMQTAEQALNQAAQMERQARSALADGQRVLDRVQQQTAWQEGLLAQLAAELAQLTEQEQSVLAHLTALTQEATTGEANLAEAEAVLASDEGGQLMTALGDLRAAEAAAQAQLRASQSTLDSQQQALAHARREQAARAQRLAELTQRLEELGGQIQRLTGQEEALTGALAQLQAQLEPSEVELSQLSQERRRLEEREAAMQQILGRDESAWRAAQLHYQRMEDRLAILRREIESDLGLVELERSPDVADQPPLPLESYVEHLPVLESVPDGLEQDVVETRARLQRLGHINPDALQEYTEAADRHQFLLTQSEDLEAAVADLHTIIQQLDRRMAEEFKQTFDKVAVEFVHFFQLLFNGGTAKLSLTDPNDLTMTGIEIVARPSGKRPQSLALLSGGERSLTALALIFAILRVSPTPFCILDEVDAALDEANVDRFRDAMQELSQETQFIIITHNRRTLEAANTIYGITMGNDGISKVISLRLEGDQMVEIGADEEVVTL